MSKVGDRVGAILGAKADEDTVEFFGYGVYEGDFVPEEAIGFLAEMAREVKLKNPRIRLDSGQMVYGCECWWGAEEQIQKKLALYKTIKYVDIDEIRARKA